jgi:hypothetical protein
MVIEADGEKDRADGGGRHDEHENEIVEFVGHRFALACDFVQAHISAAGRPRRVTNVCPQGEESGVYRPAVGQTRWIMANRKAVVRPNSSMPFSASSAPIICHLLPRKMLAWP